MRQMWLDLKIFGGSQAPLAKKMLPTEEIQEITDNVILVTTKKHKVRNENNQQYVSI